MTEEKITPNRRAIAVGGNIARSRDHPAMLRPPTGGGIKGRAIKHENPFYCKVKPDEDHSCCPRRRADRRDQPIAGRGDQPIPFTARQSPMKTILVAQGGGPTAVINRSLAGVINRSLLPRGKA